MSDSSALLLRFFGPLASIDFVSVSSSWTVSLSDVSMTLYDHVCTSSVDLVTIPLFRMRVSPSSLSASFAGGTVHLRVSPYLCSLLITCSVILETVTMSLHPTRQVGSPDLGDPLATMWVDFGLAHVINNSSGGKKHIHVYKEHILDVLFPSDFSL